MGPGTWEASLDAADLYEHHHLLCKSPKWSSSGVRASSTCPPTTRVLDTWESFLTSPLPTSTQIPLGPPRPCFCNPTPSHRLCRRRFCDPPTSCLTVTCAAATPLCPQSPTYPVDLFSTSRLLLLPLPQRPLPPDFPPSETPISCDLPQEAFLGCTHWAACLSRELPYLRLVTLR